MAKRKTGNLNREQRELQAVKRKARKLDREQLVFLKRRLADANNVARYQFPHVPMTEVEKEAERRVERDEAILARHRTRQYKQHNQHTAELDKLYTETREVVLFGDIKKALAAVTRFEGYCAECVKKANKRHEDR